MEKVNDQNSLCGLIARPTNQQMQKYVKRGVAYVTYFHKFCVPYYILGTAERSIFKFGA